MHRRCNPIAGGWAAALLLAPFAPFAEADMIDFEGLANGLEIGGSTHREGAQPYADVFSLQASSNGSPTQGAAIFDSSKCGPNGHGADKDLLVGLGNILIVQNDAYAHQSTPGFYDTPNDEEQGGTLTFEFRTAVELLSVDLIDIDANGPADVILYDIQGYTRTFAVGASWTRDIHAQGPKGWDTLDLTSLAPQVGEGGGVATAWQDPLFNASRVTRLTVSFGGSAGLDNVSFIPAPSGLAVLAAGVAGLGRRRRRARG